MTKSSFELKMKIKIDESYIIQALFNLHKNSEAVKNCLANKV